jgi:hypothetical protein
MAGAMAVAFPASALAVSPVVTFHIAGSTAYRAPVSAAIINYLGGSSAHALYAGSSLLGGTASIFEGVPTTGSLQGQTVIIAANWTGSLSGVVDITTQNSIPFFDPSNSTVSTDLASSTSACTTTASASPNNKYGGGKSEAATLVSGTAIPDAVMSDSFYTSIEAVVASTGGIGFSGQPTNNTNTAYDINPLTGDGLASAIDNASLVEAGGVANGSPVQTGSGGYLGIVPFQWVLGNLSTTGSGTLPTGISVPFTNITQEQAAYFIQAGSAPFSMFGDTAANAPSTFVFLVGRNEDSGTRVDAFAEPQLGFIPTPNQFLLTYSGTTATTSAQPPPAANNGLNTGGSNAQVTSLSPWTKGTALNTESKISWPNNSGHGGYVSGGDVAKVISTTVNQTAIAAAAKALVPEDTTGTYFMGYISIADSGGYVAPGSTLSSATDTPNVYGGTTLTYNGVAYSQAAVNNGSYSFWSYEHMYYPDGNGTLPAIGTNQQTIADTIADSVAQTFASYDSGGVNAPTTDGAGVPLVVAKSTAAKSVGSVTRGVEGGSYTLNY